MSSVPLAVSSTKSHSAFRNGVVVPTALESGTPSQRTVRRACVLNVVHGVIVKETRATRATLIVAKFFDRQPVRESVRFHDAHHLSFSALRTRQRLRCRCFFSRRWGHKKCQCLLSNALFLREYSSFPWLYFTASFRTNQMEIRRLFTRVSNFGWQLRYTNADGYRKRRAIVNLCHRYLYLRYRQS